MMYIDLYKSIFFSFPFSYRIVAIPGNVSKTSFKISGAIYLAIMIIFSLVGEINLNGTKERIFKFS